MEVSSLKLCRVVSEYHQWNKEKSYRIPGFILNDNSAAIFNLPQAEVIDKHFINFKSLYSGFS